MTYVKLKGHYVGQKLVFVVGHVSNKVTHLDLCHSKVTF